MSTIEAGTTEHTTPTTAPTAPYPPSWVDRLTAWVERLPGPGWLFYGAMWLLFLAIETLVKWGDGAYPVGTIFPFHVVFSGVAAVSLAMMHYLDQQAAALLTTFRPIVQASEAEYAALRYELTTLPARPTLLASLAGMVAGGLQILLSANSVAPNKLATSLLAGVVDTGIYLIIWWVIYGVLTYHTIHQLRLVSRIYTQHTRINLFQPGPLYAFSGLTALTAAGLTLIDTAWVSTAPSGVSTAPNLVVAMAFAVVAAVVFIWPLLGIHRRLQDEKGRLLAAAGQRMEATIAELHRRLDAGELSEITGLHNALSSLNMEQTTLARLSTWPWQPETLGGVTSVILLPMVLWLIETLLAQVLHF